MTPIYIFIRIFNVIVYTHLFVLAYAQPKRMLTPQDYSLWENAEYIVNAQVTNDGAWCAYRVGNRSGGMKTMLYDYVNAETLEFGNTVSVFQAGKDGSQDFSADSKWFAHLDTTGATLYNLRTRARRKIPGVSGYFFSCDGKLLVSWKTGDHEKMLFLTSVTNFSTDTISKVAEWCPDAARKQVAFITVDDNNASQQVSIVELTGMRKRWCVTDQKNAAFKSLIWEKSGASLAFVKTPSLQASPGSYHLYSCYKEKNSVRIFESPFLNDSPYNLHISTDGMTVFFSLRGKALRGNRQSYIKPSNVQIWNSADNGIPPFKNESGNLLSTDFVWQVATKELRAINDKRHPHAITLDNGEKALVYNRSDYLPAFRYPVEYIDIYMKDLVTGAKSLFLNKIREDVGSLAANGNYICYYKEKQWWVYDIRKGRHRCLTSGLPVGFENTLSENPGEKPSWGIGGWVRDKNYVVLYDQFDIWLLDVTGSKRLRITNGRAANTTFRLYSSRLFYGSGSKAPPHFTARGYDSGDGFLIKSVNQITQQEGFWHWIPKAGLKRLVEFGGKITCVMQPKFNSPFMYVLSGFDKPQNLIVTDFQGNRRRLYETNIFQKQFYSGRSALIHYTDRTGKPLKGALFYPASYEPGKKYPVIVEVYEKRSSELHNYIVPSKSTDQSLHIINPAHYTSQGYFVLFPDLSYEINEPGFSAAECINRAVDTLLTFAAIDSNRMGLIGHSFGGYETLFTLTQTSRFRAAVAGAAVTDLTDHYLSVSKSYGGPNLVRMEQMQFRMSSPLQSDALYRNSPLSHVSRITTPVLLWTGDKDENVDWRQSVKMQIALWRMEKTSYMLVYPGEDHSLEQEGNQKDLGIRISQWFEHYLKDGSLPEWMNQHAVESLK